MKRLLIIICLFCFTTKSFSQHSYQFKRHEGLADITGPNFISADLSLGGFGLGYAVGGEYERILGGNGRFSVFLPFHYGGSNDAFMSVADVGDRYHYYKSLYIAPGARFHPAGSYHKADFSLGLQLAIGSVNIREDYITGVATIVTKTTTSFLAPMGQINLSVCSVDGFVFGLFMQGGPVISGDFGVTSLGKKNTPGIFQFGIKLGGRF